MKRDAVDFQAIPERQLCIHARLENWGRANNSPTSGACSPMFRLYRSDEVWHAPEPSIPVDRADAAKIAKGVRELPEPHMRALGWFYVTPGSPMKIRRVIGCTAEALARYVLDGRTMLINRMI